MLANLCLTELVRQNESNVKGLSYSIVWEVLARRADVIVNIFPVFYYALCFHFRLAACFKTALPSTRTDGRWQMNFAIFFKC